MSMWQFMAAIDGYEKANSSESDSNKLSDQEKDELWEMVSGAS